MGEAHIPRHGPKPEHLIHERACHSAKLTSLAICSTYNSLTYFLYHLFTICFICLASLHLLAKLTDRMVQQINLGSFLRQPSLQQRLGRMPNIELTVPRVLLYGPERW